MPEKQTLFQQYLKQNNITFEDYEKWFKKLKVGDSTCRHKCLPDDVSKIVEVSEFGVRFVGKASQNVSIFYNLDLIKKTVFLRYSDKTIDNPENFPTLSEIDLTEFRHLHEAMISEILSTCCLSSVSEDQIHDALSSEKKEEEMSGRRPKPPLPQKNNEEKEEKTSFQKYLEKNHLTFEEYKKWFESLKQGQEVSKYMLSDPYLIAGAKNCEISFPGCYYFIREEEIYVKSSSTCSFARFFPIPSEEEVSQIKQKRGAKMLQPEQKEYPIVEIKDIRTGDLVEDPFGNKLVSCGEYLYNKDGIRECFKKELKYRLIQKKKYIRPANAFFRHNGIRESSYEKKDLWFLNCARLGREPEIERKTLFIPDFTYSLASFARKDDAFNFIESQEEPQLLSMCHGSDGKFWVTKYFTQTSVELPIDDSLNETKNQLDEQKSLNQKLKDDFVKLLEEKESFELQLKAAQEELKLLKVEKKNTEEAHASEISAMQESLRSTREQYEEFSANKLNPLTKENEELKNKLQESFVEKTSIEHHRQYLLKKVDEQLGIITFTNAQIARLVSEKDEFRNKLNNSLEQAKSLVGASLEVTKLKDRVADFMEENENLKNSLKNLEAKREALSRELDEERTISAKWSKEVAEMNKKIDKLSQFVGSF